MSLVSSTLKPRSLELEREKEGSSLYVKFPNICHLSVYVTSFIDTLRDQSLINEETLPENFKRNKCFVIEKQKTSFSGSSTSM